jgi:hypothetical protein
VGSFYVNFSVRADTPEQVAAVLLNGDRRALVTSPNPHCPYCAVFDEEADSFREAPIEWLGTRVSATCGPIHAVSNCDADSLDYWLFDLGRLVDRYSSTSNQFNPNYRTAAPRGDADVLCRHLGGSKMSSGSAPRYGATICTAITSTRRWRRWACTCTLSEEKYAVVLPQCGIQFIFPEERLLWVGPRG